MPKDKIHPNTFKGANRKFRKIPFLKIAKEKHNAPKGTKQVEKIVKRLVDKEDKKRKKN